MRLLTPGDRSGRSAEPLEKSAEQMPATGAGARPLRVRWLSLPGAVSAGERR
jgi:hypothetical protein